MPLFASQESFPVFISGWMSSEQQRGFNFLFFFQNVEGSDLKDDIWTLLEVGLFLQEIIVIRTDAETRFLEIALICSHKSNSSLIFITQD